jgi:receptor protein-tyrosine kinase
MAENNHNLKRAAGAPDESSMSSGKDDKVTFLQNSNIAAEARDTGHDGSLSDHVEDRALGQLLVDAGLLTGDDVDRVLKLQDDEDLFFGDAAQKLKLVTQDDIQHALARQYGYPTVPPKKGIFSQELVAAYEPFGKQAETFREIRSQLLFNWLNADNKVLCVVSPGQGEGRSYVAANLAVAFSQLGKNTLLVDADLRTPRQHEIFGFTRRVGLSGMLSGRIKKDELEFLPESVPFFTHFSILGAGAVPPNPVELFSGPRFQTILGELRRYFDVVIVDSPSGIYKADVQTLAAAAGSALLVTRRDHTRLEKTQALVGSLRDAGVTIAGSVLNVF